MIGILICLLIFVVVLVFSYRWSPNYNRALSMVFNGTIATIILLLFGGVFILPMTGGLYKNYGNIQQTGYLTNFGEKGVIWKTWEGELQKGVGENASLENCFKFSTTDPDMIQKLQKHLSTKQRLRITCRQWLCMPYSRGSQNKEVVAVLIIK